MPYNFFTHEITTPPKNVGGYRIGVHFKIMLTKKPHFLARWMCKLLLDWHWEEGDI
jgi:hypothetical protein